MLKPVGTLCQPSISVPISKDMKALSPLMRFTYSVRLALNDMCKCYLSVGIYRKNPHTILILKYAIYACTDNSRSKYPIKLHVESGNLMYSIKMAITVTHVTRYNCTSPSKGLSLITVKTTTNVSVSRISIAMYFTLCRILLPESCVYPLCSK